MAAPSAAFQNAIRENRVARHLFVKLEHEQGDVLAWDGLGEYGLDEEAYTGVQGLIGIEGISESYDVQEPGLRITLNAVPLSAITQTTQSVRGDTLTIKAAWIDIETGLPLQTETVFSGVADQLKISRSETDFSLTVTGRSQLYGWQVTPAVYYLPRDVVSPGDNGFNYVPDLQDTTISSWAPAGGGVGLPGGGGATPYVELVDTGGGRLILRNNITNRVLSTERDASTIAGTDFGVSVARRSDGALFMYETIAGYFWVIQPDPAGASLNGNVGSLVTQAGDNVTIDGGGYARTSSNATLYHSYTGGVNSYLREGKNPLAGGATFVSGSDVRANPSGSAMFSDVGNPFGLSIVHRNDTWDVPTTAEVLANFVEETSGRALAIDGSDYFTCGGARTYANSNGTLISNTGNKFILSGNSAVFLQVWVPA
jgi:hypothetical protein